MQVQRETWFTFEVLVLICGTCVQQNQNMRFICLGNKATYCIIKYTAQSAFFFPIKCHVFYNFIVLVRVIFTFYV